MIPQAFIQDLLNRVDVVEIVGRYVPLKKNGANFSGLCPFHNEKTPSFTVSPTKQFYHCFGCEAHGSAISFLIAYSGMGFVEAVHELARNAGMVVPEESDHLPPAQRAAVVAKSQALTDVMQQASHFYRERLRASSKAVDYLKGRGLTGEVAARFGMGYALDEWEGLRQMFPDYAAPVLVEAGLVIERSAEGNGGRQRYDRFRDRIMFPIRNNKGQVIGFGGRVLDGGEPKYLNSPETPLFQKGNELYGLFEARQAIREAGYVLVTEGYMDVVALAQLGMPHAVATLGTACTSAHVQQLLRQTDHVVFSFDGDAAGRRAAGRALEACLPYATDTRTVQFLFLPAEHDPDSFVRQQGQAAFEREIREALPLSQFLLKIACEECDLNTAEGRARAQFNAKALLQAMPSSALRLQVVRALAQATQSTAAEIEVLCALSKPVARVRQAPARTARAAPVGLERQIMRLLLGQPSLAQGLEPDVQEMLGSLAPDQGGMLAILLDASRSLGASASFAMLAELLQEKGEDFQALVAEVSAESPIEPDLAQAELAGAVRQLQLKAIKDEMNTLAASGLTQPNALARYRELTQLQEQLRQEGLASQDWP